MARIRFEPSGFETDALVGAVIVDLTDEHPAAEVPYSCRSASCGTCRVEVIEGLEALSPIEDDEREVLEVFEGADNVRLCCQIRLAHDCERVVLRVCDPEW